MLLKSCMLGRKVNYMRCKNRLYNNVAKGIGLLYKIVRKNLIQVRAFENRSQKNKKIVIQELNSTNVILKCRTVYISITLLKYLFTMQQIYTQISFTTVFFCSGDI